MTWTDHIVEEVRLARNSYAAKFNYDLRAISRDLKEQQLRGGRKVISFAKNSSTAGLIKTPHSAGIVVSESQAPYSDEDQMNK